jgi:hypothetical protein
VLRDLESDRRRPGTPRKANDHGLDLNPNNTECTQLAYLSRLISTGLSQLAVLVPAAVVTDGIACSGLVDERLALDTPAHARQDLASGLRDLAAAVFARDQTLSGRQLAARVLHGVGDACVDLLLDGSVSSPTGSHDWFLFASCAQALGEIRGGHFNFGARLPRALGRGNFLRDVTSATLLRHGRRALQLARIPRAGARVGQDAVCDTALRVAGGKHGFFLRLAPDLDDMLR